MANNEHHENDQIDQYLADATDKLMAGENPQVPEHLRDLVVIVRQLKQQVSDTDPARSGAFRAALRQRLEHEWAIQHAPHSLPQRSHQPLPWYRSRLGRLTAAAAALIVVLGAVALLVTRGEDEGGAIQGTAWGSIGGAMIVLVGIALLAVAAVWFYRRRQ